MKNDLDAPRGILFGLLVSVVFWTIGAGLLVLAFRVAL